MYCRAEPYYIVIDKGIEAVPALMLMTWWGSLLRAAAWVQCTSVVVQCDVWLGGNNVQRILLRGLKLWCV